LAALAAVLLAACSEAPLLDLRLVTPDGPDPLSTADRVRLVVSEPATEQTMALTSSQSFSVELKAEVAGAAGSVILEGYAGDVLVARGETPPMALRPSARQMSLLVGRAGALSALRPGLQSAGANMISVLLPGRGVLLVGGLDGSDRALSDAALYDFFEHAVAPVAPLPEARAGAVGATCGSTCAVVALGESDKGMADHLLVFDGETWTSVADGLSPAERRREAGIALLGDGTYLIVGGEGPAGALDTVLRLTPGSDTSTPTLDVLAARARAARVRPAVAAGTGAVVVAAGQSPGAPAAEIFYTTSSSFQALALPGPSLSSGTAASDLGDGRIAIVGGRDAAGTLLRDAWIVDPVTVQVTHLANCLAEARVDHQLARTGQHLVVLGGQTASGLAASAEVLEVKGLTRIRDTPMQALRTAFTLGRLGPGSFLVAGGRGGSGATAVALMEVYETAIPMGP
jgi:hypothetical protein